ncbi:hypothetical protein DB35_14265 [Streptomyces abyssalis]|uniref:Uncharacterized protein n=2 Tax=Streptomyces abyssalis TaxID=933944 RepID=A0A1E7JIL6_9ACTN|nr:hypothetical protein AN215_23740 [Streptomyces abyssalis]OEU93355.1 hypothetical protein DB35_14265 [Streptomyces abyssalis]OEV30821.1 hypothetical protein AN219_08795 [Streptomyces nanshensis]
MTDRSVVASCLLGSRVRGTGLSRVVPGAGERPATALQVAAAVAPAAAYAFAFAAAGVGDGSQKTKHNPMWAFRGLEPWRDPA